MELYFALTEKKSPDKILRMLSENPEMCKLPIYYNSLPLFWACTYKGSLEVIKKMVEIHPDACQVACVYDMMPLHVACVNYCFLDVISLLIDKYPKACEHRDKGGNTPLHYASRHGNVKVVSLLISAYPEACRISNHSGQTPLHYACDSIDNCSADVLNLIIKTYPEACQMVSGKRYLPIHILLSRSHATYSWVPCIQLLLRHYPYQLHQTLDEWRRKPIDLIMEKNLPFLSRFALNADPSSINNPQCSETYHELNWKARKAAVRISLHAQSKLGNHPIPPEYSILLRLLNKFEQRNISTIASGEIKYILGYL